MQEPEMANGYKKLIFSTLAILYTRSILRPSLDCKPLRVKNMIMSLSTVSL